MAESRSKRPARPRKPAQNVVKMPAPEPVIDHETPFDPPEPPTEPEPTPPIAATPASASGKAFPTAPRANGKGGYCDFEATMDYWRSLPPEFIARTNIYIYREWPVLDRLQELTPEQRAEIANRRRRAPFKHIDKPADPFGPDSKMEFLQRYGSGTYKIYVNDAGVKGAGKDPELQPHTLCKAVVQFIDSDFPPVLDPSRPDKGLGILDRKHPANASYLAELQARGVLPLDSGDDMNGSSVVKDLADKVGALASQVAEGKQQEMMTTLKEIAASAKTNGGGGTENLLLALLPLMMQKPPDNTAVFVQMAQQQSQMYQSQLTALETRLAEERAERRRYEEATRERANAAPPDPFAQFTQTMNLMEKAKDFFKTAANGTAETVVKHATKMSGTLEFFAEVLPKIADSPILNALAARLMQGNPAASMPTAPGQAPGQSSAPPSQAQLLQFVQQITPAMLQYLETDNSGGDFAEWVLCGYPDRLQQLQSQGPAVIVATYQGSPLWPRLAPREMQFRQFVEDFCKWRPDAEPADDDAIDFDAPEGQTAASARPPVVVDFDAMQSEPLGGAAIA